MTASFGLRDIFERPFDGEDDPRIRVAQAITRAEAEAILEHRGDLILALSAPSPVEGGGDERVKPAPNPEWEAIADAAHAEIRAEAGEPEIAQTLTMLKAWKAPAEPADEQGRITFSRALLDSATDALEAAIAQIPTSPPQATNSEVEGLTDERIAALSAQIVDARVHYNWAYSRKGAIAVVRQTLKALRAALAQQDPNP